MKKMMMILTAALAATSLLAGGRTLEELRAGAKAALEAKDASAFDAYCAGVTADEWRTVGDGLLALAATNAAKASALIYDRAQFLRFAMVAPASVMAEYDKPLADAGATLAAPWNYKRAPNLTEAWIAAPTNAAKVSRMQAAVSLMRKHGTIGTWWRDFTPPELANLAVEAHVFTTSATGGKMVDKVLGLVQKDVKRAIRAKGQSFVAKDGKNPVQDEIDALSAAFNAPRCAGVKEWVAKVYPDYKWTDSAELSGKEVDELKERVMNGDSPFDDRNQAVLRFYLGVEEYNRFVKLYNGEEAGK